MREESRLLKNTGLIALGNFGAKMVSFLLLPLYTSILDKSSYGTYEYIIAVCAFLLPVVTVSMHEAMFRFIIDTGNKGEEFKRIISNAMFTVITCNALMAGVLTFLHFGFHLEHMLAIGLYVFTSALYTFTNNLLRGMGKIKEYAIISSGKNIVQLMLNVLVVAVLRWGITGLLFSNCVAEFLAFLVVALFSRLWTLVRIKFLSKDTTKVMLKYSLPLIPNTLCGQIINLSDRIIVKNILGSGLNGIYAISYKFPNMVETVYHYFYTAWSESASRVFSRGKEEAAKYYQSLYEHINNLVFSISILMISGMPVLVRIFVRGDYTQGFDYIWILQLAMYFDCLAKFYSGLFTALKKTDVMAVSTAIAAAANIIINLVLIREFGLYAAAGSTLVADVLLVLIRRKALIKYIGIRISKKRVVIEALVLSSVLLLYSYDNWIKTIVSILVSLTYSISANMEMIKKSYVTMKSKRTRKKEKA